MLSPCVKGAYGRIASPMFLQTHPRPNGRPLSRTSRPLCFANALLYFSLAAIPALSAEIQASTANRTSVVGGGYQSEKQLLVGQCLTCRPQTTATTTSTFNFAQSLKEQQASSELGLGAGGRARFGAVEVSASASFMAQCRLKPVLCFSRLAVRLSSSDAKTPKSCPHSRRASRESELRALGSNVR
jgi:hypothetical protein